MGGSHSKLLLPYFSRGLRIQSHNLTSDFRFAACNINFIAPAGVIKSPGYPNEYSSEQKCSYQITVPAGQQILLNFTVFDLEYDPKCKFDFLEIR